MRLSVWRLIIRSLSDLEGDTLATPGLEELNAFGCRRLEPAGLATLIAAAPRLQLLNLNGCTSLAGDLALLGRAKGNGRPPPMMAADGVHRKPAHDSDKQHASCLNA